MFYKYYFMKDIIVNKINKFLHALRKKEREGKKKWQLACLPGK